MTSINTMCMKILLTNEKSHILLKPLWRHLEFFSTRYAFSLNLFTTSTNLIHLPQFHNVVFMHDMIIQLEGHSATETSNPS